MVNKTLLYHNVLNLNRLISILEKGKILKDERIAKPAVYFTRDSKYLAIRGIQMVFDREKLSHRYKIKPFCLFGYYAARKIPTKLRFVDEFEERIYSDVDITKTCIEIRITGKKFKTIPPVLLENPLIKIV